MKKTLISLIALLTVHIQAKAGLEPELLFVGQGGGVCIFNDIQDAIDHANLDIFTEYEIRVTRELTRLENLTITRNLTIKGGYTSCGFAQLDNRLDESRTIIDAGGTGNAVVVTGSVTELHMSGFTLTNGNFSGAAEGGAVSILSDDTNIVFEQMNIWQSVGMFGGGIHVIGNSVDLTLSNTLVAQNIATYNGGGIYCGNSSIVNLNNGSGILGNVANGNSLATGNGGGIYASNCTLVLSSGEGGIADFRLVGISNNLAVNSGGGIYMNGGFITPSIPYAGVINIDNNTANGDGGGIYIVNNGILVLYKMFFASNTAFTGNGGAVFMDNSNWIANSNAGEYDFCLLNENQECNLFINNKAIGAGLNLGGAIYMQNSSGSIVGASLRARFIDNRADGGAAITVNSGSTINLQNSYFVGNGNNGDDETSDFNVIRVNGAGSEVDISFSTLANNRNNYAIALLNGGQARLYKSIVYEEQPLTQLVTFPTNSVNFSFGCSVFHEGVTPGPFPGLNNSLITTDPGFVNPANNNYHLRFDSPAVDRCNLIGLSPDIEIRIDFDADERPIDIPDVNNGGLASRVYDAGADEYNVTDIIFIDGFE